MKTRKSKKRSSKQGFSLGIFLRRRVENRAQIFAWLGTLCILTSYFLTTFGIIKQGDPIQHGLNLLGAIGIISISLPRHIYQSIFLNSIWAIVALVGLLKLLG